jgi:hypothetical protein
MNHDKEWSNESMQLSVGPTLPGALVKPMSTVSFQESNEFNDDELRHQRMASRIITSPTSRLKQYLPVMSDEFMSTLRSEGC